MKINHRIIVILCVVLTAFLIALAIISHFFILNTFSDIEHKQATADMQRVLAQLGAETTDVADTCREWAQRDDTYEFVTDLNPRYIQSNFADPALFSDIKINYILFYNSSGNLVYSRGYNSVDGASLEIPPELDAIIRNSIIPSGVPGGVSGRRGFSLLNGEPIVLAGYQIHVADQPGPPAGTLVMVRQLDAGQINSIAQQTDLAITLSQFPKTPTGSLSNSDLQQIANGAILVMPVNDSVMEGAAYITGIEDTPTKILVTVETSRALYQQIQVSIVYIEEAIIILAVILIFVIRWPLKKYIVNPILSLDSTMKTIGKSGNLNQNISVKGDDEILSLANSLNRMLEEIDKAHQQALESESKFRTLAETSIVGILVYRQKILYVNPAAESQTGYTKEELWKMNFWDFVHPEYQEVIKERIRRRLQGESLSPIIEFKIIRKDGEERWIEAATTRFQYEGEMASFTICADITSRKRIEEALRQNEEKFRTLTENTPDVVFSADLNGILTYISPQVENFGFLADELVGKSLFDIVLPDDRPKFEENFRTTIEDGNKHSTPFRILDRWQNLHWLEVNFAVVQDISGKWTGLQGIIRDITERRNALDAIALANRKLNLMYDITRHDILNKITILFGLVDMTKASSSPEEREQYLNEIMDAGETIHKQIVLTRDYQEVGVKSPRWNPMTEIINRTISNFSGTGIHFVSDLENIEIFADPLIEKVIYNLVDNAIRYGKKITTISFSNQISDSGFELICEDDGIGVVTGEKEKIFDRGFGNNTGLGLFLSREILMITGITIRETGEPGKGARFIISLPRGTFRFVEK
jgi:PAS domain S-box-containing protein